MSVRTHPHPSLLLRYSQHQRPTSSERCVAAHTFLVFFAFYSYKSKTINKQLLSCSRSKCNQWCRMTKQNKLMTYRIAAVDVAFDILPQHNFGNIVCAKVSQELTTFTSSFGNWLWLRKLQIHLPNVTHLTRPRSTTNTRQSLQTSSDFLCPSVFCFISRM